MAERVTVFTTMPPGVYSGGRYLSLMLATAMARAGAEVAYVTNNAPLFEADFQPYDAVAPVRRVVAPKFDLPADLRSDWVVVIPTGNFDGAFYGAALSHARRSEARVALLSFETPNWYDALSPFPRSPMPTESWRQVVAGGGLVVTIAREGLAPAAAFFGPGTPDAPIRYGHWHPTINDLAAEAAARPPEGEPRVRVTAFVRVEDPHKGAQDLLRLPPDLFRGHVLSLVFGRGVPVPYLDALRRHYGPARDVVIEVHSQIADLAKFELLARSRLLLFPSTFEGYGYPPVEAAWMGVPTVAYDLPLLREVAGEAVTTVPLGDVPAFAEAARAALARGPDPTLRDRMPVRPDTLTGGRAMLDLLRRAGRGLPPAGPPPKATPIPPGGGADLPAVRRLLSQQGAAAQLVDARARLAGGLVVVQGAVVGGAEGDLVRLDMAGLRIPEAGLGAAEGRSRPFAATGELAAWPGGAEARIDVTLLRRDGPPEGLGHLPLDPDWRALLERPSPGGLEGTAAEAVLLADPARLARRPAEAAALAEAAEALRRAGHATRLLWRAGPDSGPGAGPEDPEAVPLDLMPLVDRAEAVPEADWADRLAAARGLVVALGPGAPDPARPVWRVRVGAGEAAPTLVLRHPQVAADAEFEVARDPALGRRGLARREGHAVVLLVPAEPVAEVPEAVRRLLAAAERALPSLRALVPRRLWAAPGPAPVGLWSWVEPLPDGAIPGAVAAGDRVAGLALGAPADAAAASLLLALTGQDPLGQVGPEAGDEELADLRRALLDRLGAAEAPADGSLSAVLARLAPPRPVLRRPGAGRRPPAGATGAPPLGTTGAQGFAVGAPGPAERMLAQGWAERTAHGARLTGPLGLLAFEIAPEAARPAAIEVMLRHPARPEAAPSVDVLLNGHLLGTVRPAAPGVSSHVVGTPARCWAARGPQVVGLRPARPSEMGTGSELQLVALALRRAAPSLPAWSSFAPGPRPLAHVVHAAATPADGAGRVAFGTGQRVGRATLQAGWAAPEAGQVWSDGPLAAIVLGPPLPGSAPVLLDIEASGYAPPGADGAASRQRARLATDAGPLAEWILTAATGRAAAAIPPGAPTDHVVIGLPDAVRPADLGASQDVRRLGLRLASLGLTPLAPVGPAAEARAVAEDEDEAVADLACGRVLALRVEGSGTLPPGAVLTTPGGRTLVPLRARGEGWEAMVPLDGDLAAGRASVVALAPGGAPSLAGVRVEPWGEAGGGGAAAPLRVTLVAATAPDDDVRGWGEGVVADLLLGRDRPRLAAPQRVELGERAPEGVLARGWSRPDEGGTWSAGPAAALDLPVRAEGAVAVLGAAAYLPAARPAQRVVVAAGDRRLATLDLRRRGLLSVALALPAGGPPVARLDLGFPDALSPQEAGESGDVRRLGLWAATLDLMPLAADPADAGRLEGSGGVEAEVLGRTAAGAAVRLRRRGAAPWAAGAEGDPVLVHPVAAGDGWAATLVLPIPEGGASRVLLHGGPPGPGAPAPEALTLAWRAPRGVGRP